jgi:photosystem II stability/assembly factor-like uncharacterized protein/murein DD-endopeptidase MepM/ murein hydrolase activator NlpD
MTRLYTFAVLSWALLTSHLLGQDSWEQTNGPYGGNINCYVFSGTNLFAGTHGGGLFRSTNNGTSWAPVNSGLANGYVLSLWASGSNLFAGTSGSGLFISRDNGNSWTAANTGLGASTVYALAISGSVLFAGTGGWGVFLSTNNGTSWAQANSGLGNLIVKSLVVSGSNVFAGTWGGVFRSSDNGASWIEVNAGLTNQYVQPLLVNGSNLFAGTLGGGVFRSTNNGTTWTAVNSGLTSTAVWSLAVSGSNLFAGTTGGVFLSTNNGTSWTPVSRGLTNMDVRSLAANGSSLFAGTYGGGAFLSMNNGVSWTAVNAGLIGVDVRSLATNGSSLFAGTYGGGVFLSSNKGTSWTAVSSGTTDQYIQSLAVSGSNVFAGTHGGGIFRSTDNGASWSAANAGLIPADVRSLTSSGVNVFAGTGGGGIFLSTNNGASWTAVNAGLTNQYVQALLVNGSSLFAGTYGGIFLSTNNGVSWTAVNTGLTNQYVQSLVVYGSKLFAGTSGGGIFRSTDNGTTWTAVNSGLTNMGVWSLAFRGSNLVAGTSGGVFLSMNDGVSWTALRTGLTNDVANALIFDLNGNLFAGTSGAGVFRNAQVTVQPTITVLHPNGEETWYKTRLYAIQWTSTNYSGDVEIFLYKGGSKVQDISYSEPATGTFSFIPDCGLAQGSNYRIRVAASGSGNTNDYSDAPFTITNQPSGDPCGVVFKLKFPLEMYQNDGPYTHDITSVFDHSMPNEDPYCPANHKVVDCWGESGVVPYTGERFSYQCDDIYGYSKEIGELPREFKGFGEYYKGNPSTVLFYDNHPGYDYRAPVNLEGVGQIVTAVARGKVFYPTSSPEFADGSRVHAVAIEHQGSDNQLNGYVSYYLHMYTYENVNSPFQGDPATPHTGDIVEKGQYIGRSGAIGAPGGPHLHFGLYYHGKPIDPYGWNNATVLDPYVYHASLPGGKAIALWESMASPQAANATLIQEGSSSYSKNRNTTVDAKAIRLEWVFAADSVTGFEIDRYGSDGSTRTTTAPSNGSPYYELVDNAVVQDVTYTYYIRAFFLNGTSSGSSSPAVIYSAPCSNSTRTLYAFENHTVPFAIDSSGLYRLSLTQPSQQVTDFRRRTGFASEIDSIGFFVQWELVDPSGQRTDRASPTVGSIIYTETSQSFAFSVNQNQMGIWNLVLSGTENIPIGDSLIVTTKEAITSEPVIKLGSDALDFGAVEIGSTRIESVQVKNIGNLPSHTAWHYEGPKEFVVRTDSATMMPSAELSISVAFSPLDSSFVVGVLIFTEGGGKPSDTLVVSGSGVVLVSVLGQENSSPDHFFLNQNYPNPFNPATIIEYALPREANVLLEVYNLLGQRVALLVNVRQNAGYHQVVFQDSKLASGVYFYRLRAGDFVETKKLVVLR